MTRSASGQVYRRNVAQHGDALMLLRSLPDSDPCTPLVFFDPQFRSNLDKQKYGNEGGRQRGRCALPQMTDAYIDECCFEIARVLRPSGYLMLWADAYRLLEGYHLRLRGVLDPVDRIAWNNGYNGQGYRARRYGSDLIVLQKPPKRAKATWRDHNIPDRWHEKVGRKLRDFYPHVKPIGLISRLIGSVTEPGELVVDPAAGSFIVMHAAHQLNREFIGCDIAYRPETRENLFAVPAPARIPDELSVLHSMRRSGA
jgi:site-specific DNA-methyltransferase (adenine-specific)